MILLLDVMDTLVRDPFRELPAMWGLSMAELLEAKTPDAWPRFERGELTEADLTTAYFRDGRAFDVEAVKAFLSARYAWLDGVEALLVDLAGRGVDMHALSNYPDWYRLIEARLGLSRYVGWSFVSCATGVRKPDPQAYLGPAAALGVRPSECLFVDDRAGNVRAAEAAGMPAIRFQGAAHLRAELVARGVL